MLLLSIFGFLSATAKPYDIPEAKALLAIPDSGWRITRENQSAGPTLLRVSFVADQIGATITVTSITGGPVGDDSLAEFADGMKMFFGENGGKDVSQEKTSFSGVPAVRLKGLATIGGITREQEALAYIIGEVGWVIVCAAPEGGQKILATVTKLVAEKK